MDYKHCCVIDAQGHYVTLVLVHLGPDGQEQIQYYALPEGEQLVDALSPSRCPFAGADGLISPIWDGTAWAEAATDAEIAAWELEHPAPPPPGPSTDERLTATEQQLTDTQLALAECYEYSDTQNTNVMLALTEVYETMLGGGAISG